METTGQPTEAVLLKDALAFLGDLPAESVDLAISSPPYFIGKEYDTSRRLADFIQLHEQLSTLLVRAIKPGGSICWQVGNHVRDNVVVPLDALVYAAFSKSPALRLRNRIVWIFGHGAHCERRFSGRHETVLWFTKGDKYAFGLDAVRIPQLYPGKRHYKGAKRGELSGNPLGKNPGDVWEIPNVKSRHVEKTDHPCQFPVALAQRLVRALCPAGGLVVDPYMGAGSAGVAARIEGRGFMGCDIEPRYVEIAAERLKSLQEGTLKVRPLDKPVYKPGKDDRLARRPAEWAQNGQSASGLAG